MSGVKPPTGLRTSEIAATAAHEITPRVVASWLPSLVRDPRVLVPIQLDALVVRAGQTGPWADCHITAPDPSTSGSSPDDARTLLPSPFAKLDPGKRMPGVYLHWALPDALTRGTQSVDPSNPDAPRTTSFPPIPDRWLVVRIGPDRASGHRPVTGVVLQIEGETPVVTVLDDYRGAPRDTSTHGRLTALGHGDPAWAAYFDNVQNRLGYYDPLPRDQASGAIAYVICGWYADPADDPLAASQTPSLTHFEARLRDLGWQLDTSALDAAQQHSQLHVAAAARYGLAAPVLGSALDTIKPQILDDAGTLRAISATSRVEEPEYLSASVWWPQQTLCHGCAVGIGWPTDQWPGNPEGGLSTDAAGPPPADAVAVALGATAGEALGAVVAKSTGSVDDIRLVEAFGVHALAELDRPGGRAHLDAALHAAAFGAVPGGSVEAVIREPPYPPAPDLPTTPVPPQPGIFADRVREPGFRPPDLSFISAREARFGESVVTGCGHASPLRSAESSLLRGGLADAVAEVGTIVGAPPGPAPHPARDVTVRRSLPRLFHPSDPALLLQGARRSFKHGADGRMTPDGELVCRLTGACVSALTVHVSGQPDATLTGPDLLMRGVENGSVPPECEELLAETVLLDPGSALAAAVAGAAGQPASPDPVRLRNTMVEQTVWWALRDPAIDPAPIITRSGYTGHLPSPIAVTPPQRPWVPLHLDWEAEFTPSRGGVHDWTLDETDFVPAADAGTGAGGHAQSGTPRVLRGRSLLTAGIAQAAGDSARKALEEATRAAGSGALPPGVREQYHSALHEVVVAQLRKATASVAIEEGTVVPVSTDGGSTDQISAADRARLGSIAELLEGMDVLATTLDGLDEQLRGGAPVIVGPATRAPEQPPEGMLALRAGELRVTRLRLVDCFGQTLDLAGSSDKTQADPSKILLGDVIAVPDQPTSPPGQSTPAPGQPTPAPAQPPRAMLPPRFTAPARLWLRWADTTTGHTDGDIMPVCGFVLADHLDGALELFDAAGSSLGTIRPDDSAGVAFDQAPGRPATVGQALDLALPDPRVRGLVQGLLDWGRADATVDREHALSGLLRAIDSTLWSVDPFGNTGEEHLSLLVGHPIVVMRASLRLEVQDPVNPPQNAWTAVPVRLGALAHWDDGLLGFFVDEDYSTFHAAEAAVLMARDLGPQRGLLGPITQVPQAALALGSGLGGPGDPYQAPVTHPFVSRSDLIWIRPGQETSLTLLVEPQTTVHATTGLLPRKEIGMRREWVAGGLAAIAPTFRFGPVLVDPKQVSLPLARDIAGTWSWDHRTDVLSWAKDAVVDTGQGSGLHDDPAIASEGWLRLSPPPATGSSGGGQA